MAEKVTVISWSAPPPGSTGEQLCLRAVSSVTGRLVEKQ